MIFIFFLPLKDAFRAGQHFAKHYPQSMDHIRRLSRERHELNKGKEFCSAPPLNSNSVATYVQNNNSNIDQDTTESCPSNYQSVISNSNVAAASNCEVYSPTSNRSKRSKVEVVATESKIGTANLMTSALKTSDLVNESKSLELNCVSCPNVNTNSRSVPDQAFKITETSSTLVSLLAKRTYSGTNLLTQFSESKSKFLGFRNRDLEDKISLNGASMERVSKLKGN